jgi:ABC-type lipoprotein release transport system permease subunit
MSRERPRGSLRHARLQWVLAVAAIAAAVALPVVLVSVGGGVSAHELAELENAGYQIVVSAGGSHGITGAHHLASEIAAIGSVTVASPILSVAIDAFNSTGPGASVSPVLAEGVIPDQFTPTLGPSEAGLFPNPLPLGDPTDMIHFANGTYAGPATYDVLLSTPLASAKHIDVGQSILLAPSTNRSQGIAYHVTGTFGVPPSLLGPTGAFAIVLPLSDLQVIAGYGPAHAGSVFDAADTIEVAVAGPVSDNPSALTAIRNAIQALVPLYGVTSLTQEAQQLQAASAVLTGFYLALSSVGLAVGLIFLALVLLRRVETGRRSIAIQRALGLPARSIAAGILLEGAAIAAAGAVVGVLAGYVVVASLARWATSAVQEAASLAVFDPVTLAALAVGVVALSAFASVVATRAALRLEITEALR